MDPVPQPLELKRDRSLKTRHAAPACQPVDSAIAPRAAGRFVLEAMPIGVAEQQLVHQPLKLVAALGPFVDLAGEWRKIRHVRQISDHWPGIGAG